MTVRLHIEVPETIHRAAKRTAMAQGVTLKAFSIQALQDRTAALAAAKPKEPARPPRLGTRRR